MNFKLLSRLLAVTILAGIPVHMFAAEPSVLPDSSNSPPTNAVILWNSRDLAGWNLYFTNSNADSGLKWSATDGALHLASKSFGYLRTENTFSNYHIHAEWRWPVTNGNSGVFVHLNGPDAIWPVSVECQLKTGAAGELVGQGGVDFPAPLINGKKRAKISVPSERPIHEWNAYDIFCRGDSIETFVNGVRQQRIEKVTVTRGSIGLQMEGFPVEFRNLWLVPFGDGGP